MDVVELLDTDSQLRRNGTRVAKDSTHKFGHEADKDPLHSVDLICRLLVAGSVKNEQGNK